VVFKTEIMAKGPNVRFVVTSRTDEEPLALYDWYVERGEAEGWVKDLKNACHADRLSCHRFWANQFRLLLHAAAYSGVRLRLASSHPGQALWELLATRLGRA
jgi:hypothetical protein